MEYKILYGSGETIGKASVELTDKVSRHCAEGWKLQGGVSIATEEYGYSALYNLAQAIIKE